MIKTKHKDGYVYELMGDKGKRRKGHALPLNEPDGLLWQKVTATVRPLLRQRYERVGDWQDFCDGLEPFPKSRTRFSDKNCDEKQTVETQISDSIESHSALACDNGFLTAAVASSPLFLLPPSAKKSEEIAARKNPGKNPGKNPRKNPEVSLDRTPVGIPSASSRKARRKMAHQYFDEGALLDLHGVGADAAYDLLLRFIRENIVRNQLLVLVITGKGRSTGSVGILRQLVPQWLASAPFRSHVGAIEVAGRHHGGEGAFYIRLRRLNSHQSLL